jgi:hypothetical protein
MRGCGPNHGGTRFLSGISDEAAGRQSYVLGCGWEQRTRADVGVGELGGQCRHCRELVVVDEED